MQWTATVLCEDCRFNCSDFQPSSSASISLVKRFCLVSQKKVGGWLRLEEVGKPPFLPDHFNLQVRTFSISVFASLLYCFVTYRSEQLSETQIEPKDTELYTDSTRSRHYDKHKPHLTPPTEHKPPSQDLSAAQSARPQPCASTACPPRCCHCLPSHYSDQFLQV